MPVTIKERDLPFRKSFPDILNSSGESHPSYPQNGEVILATGKQKTVSEGHPYNPSEGRREGGGPFFTSRIDYDFSFVDVEEAYTQSAGGSYYSGPIYCPLPTPNELIGLGITEGLKFGDPNESSLNSDGAVAISLASPNNSAADLGTALGESYKDGLPSLPGIPLWKSQTLKARQAGSEYLNHQFGWVPLANDVQSVGRVARNSRDIANQYQRREGQDVHRSFEFPLEEQVSTLQGEGSSARFPGWFTSFIYQGGPKPIQRQLVRVVTTKRWFEGLFTLALPSQDDFWRKHQEAGREADRLLGLKLDPDLLWELAPWSWAIDWFSNASQVINNVTNFGTAGQVMRYGYMMEETIDRVVVTQDYAMLRAPNEPWERNVYLGPLWSSVTTTTKRRAKANPFGFGLDWEGLSPTQLAITAALGISRLL